MPAGLGWAHLITGRAVLNFSEMTMGRAGPVRWRAHADL